MRIGILTHPQGANYGGILQCYALSTYLKKLGHTPIVIRRESDRGFFLWTLIRVILKALHFPRYYTPNACDKTRLIRPFVERHLERTHPIRSQKKMKNICEEYKLDAVIVGSDQVWRADYAMNFGYNYFLDFVPSNVKKISYAASFGLSDWQYDLEQTNRIKHLLSSFSGVSVREENAVCLCEENLCITPKWLLDPTMLLKVEDYERIISPRIIKDKYIFVYWLGDKSLVSKDIEIYKKQGYEIVDINLRDEREQESVEDWLSYIYYADCIITDSFHGCVFSILFRKRFVVRLNKSGGTSRLESLFKMMEISTQGQEIINPNYENKELEYWRTQSYNYLSETLK